MTGPRPTTGPSHRHTLRPRASRPAATHTSWQDRLAHSCHPSKARARVCPPVAIFGRSSSFSTAFPRTFGREKCGRDPTDGLMRQANATSLSLTGSTCQNNLANTRHGHGTPGSRRARTDPLPAVTEEHLQYQPLMLLFAGQPTYRQDRGWQRPRRQRGARRKV